VDTHWKKQPLGANNSNAGAAKTTTTAAPLLRSQSMRTNVANNARQISSSNLQGRTVANAKVEATGKRK